MYFATNPLKRCTFSATAFWYAEMTSRRSSGSIRAESAVEPTRSENMTVTWRRSPVSADRCVAAGAAATASHGTALLDVLEVGNGAKQFAAMSERPNTNLFEVL